MASKASQRTGSNTRRRKITRATNCANQGWSKLGTADNQLRQHFWNEDTLGHRQLDAARRAKRQGKQDGLSFAFDIKDRAGRQRRWFDFKCKHFYIICTLLDVFFLWNCSLYRVWRPRRPAPFRGPTLWAGTSWQCWILEPYLCRRPRASDSISYYFAVLVVPKRTIALTINRSNLMLTLSGKDNASRPAF